MSKLEGAADNLYIPPLTAWISDSPTWVIIREVFQCLTNV